MGLTRNSHAYSTALAQAMPRDLRVFGASPEMEKQSADGSCPCAQASDTDIYTCRCYGSPMIKSKGWEKSAAEAVRKPRTEYDEHCPHCDHKFVEKGGPRRKHNGESDEEWKAGFDSGDYDEHCPECDGIVDRRELSDEEIESNSWADDKIKEGMRARRETYRKRKAARESGTKGLEKTANRLTDLLRAGKLGKDSLQRLGIPELALPSVAQTSRNLRAAVHQNLSPALQEAFGPQAPGLWRLYNGARNYEPGIGISPAQLFKLQDTAGVTPLQELRFKLQGTPPHPLLRVANKSTKDLRDAQLLPPKIKLLASRKYDQSGGWASRGNFDSAHSYFEGLGPRRIHRGRVSYRVAGPRARVVVSGGAIDPGAPARPGIMGVLAHELGHQKENLEPQFSNYLRRRLSAMLSPTMGPVIGSLDEVPGELVGHLRATGLPASLGGMQAKRLPIAYMLEKDREGLTATRDFLRQQYPGMSNGLLGRVLSARAHAAANYAVPFQRPGSMLKSAAIAAITPFEKLAHYRRFAHAHRSPSPAQIASQNFKMGHLDFHGIDITIENEKGSIRRGTTKEGKKWESVLTCPYGYIRSAAGGKSGERVRPKAIDGDHLDVFVGPNKSSELVVAIDQYLGGKYDESKFVLGCDSEDEGVRLYRSNYQRGWPEMPSTTCTRAQFKEWLKDGDHKKPFAGQMVKAASRFG